MDDERHKTVLADGIRRAYADLFKLNNKADEKDAAWVKNKLKILAQGTKSDVVLARMAATFVALCKEGDFSTPAIAPKETKAEAPEESPVATPPNLDQSQAHAKQHRFALAYNIHIELPAVRDQAVYDAIFKSLRENLL